MQPFNIVIVGTGGQGLITLIKILSQAALFQGYDVKTSELHGLSQRGGSVETHVRFGKEIFSPLVKEGEADLIIALEAQEAQKACYYASKEAKTIFLVNDFFVPILGEKLKEKKDILRDLERFSKKTIVLSASDICQREIKTPVVAGVFMISFASFKNIMPLNPKSILEALKKVLPEKYLKINKKTFKLAKRKSKSL